MWRRDRDRLGDVDARGTDVGDGAGGRDVRSQWERGVGAGRTVVERPRHWLSGDRVKRGADERLLGPAGRQRRLADDVVGRDQQIVDRRGVRVRWHRDRAVDLGDVGLELRPVDLMHVVAEGGWRRRRRRRLLHDVEARAVRERERRQRDRVLQGRLRRVAGPRARAPFENARTVQTREAGRRRSGRSRTRRTSGSRPGVRGRRGR